MAVGRIGYRIYIIRNEVNGKVYVGITNNIKRRWIQHKHRANKGCDYHLYNAINKYGIDNFIIKEIDRTNSLHKAYRKEQFWIKYYNSFKGKGYNLTEGGEGVYGVGGERHFNATVDNTTVSYIKWCLTSTDLSYESIAEIFNCDKSILYDIATNRSWTNIDSTKPPKSILSEDKISELYLREYSSSSLNKVSNKDVAEMKWLVNQGYTLISIGEVFDVCDGSVRYNVNKRELVDPIEVDISKDRYKGLIKSHYKLTDKVKQEIVQRYTNSNTTYKEVGQMYNISEWKVGDIIRRYKDECR